MKEIIFLENQEQIKAMWEQTRYPMLNLLIRKSMTGAQLARKLNIPRSRAHYHLKILEKAGMIQFQEEKVKDGMVEKYYRAVARNFRIPAMEIHDVDTLDPSLDDNARGRLYRQIILTLIEQIRADMTIPNVDDADFYRLGRGNFQNTVLATEEQMVCIKKKINELHELLVRFENENMALINKKELTPLRVTAIQSPVSPLNFDIPDISEDNGD